MITETRHEKSADLLEVVFTGARPTDTELIETLKRTRLIGFSKVAGIVNPKKGEPGIVRLARSAKISEKEIARIGLFHLIEMVFRGERSEGDRTVYRIRPIHPGIAMEYRQHKDRESATRQAVSLTVKNLLLSDIRSLGVSSLPCASCGCDNPVTADECEECGTEISVWGVEKPVLDENTVIPCEVCGSDNHISEKHCPECGSAIHLYGVRRPAGR